jgi:hypothetical protein
MYILSEDSQSGSRFEPGPFRIEVQSVTAWVNLVHNVINMKNPITSYSCNLCILLFMNYERNKSPLNNMPTEQRVSELCVLGC